MNNLSVTRLALVAGVLLTHASANRAVAQDTTRHSMPGMPGMPMPTAPAKAKAKAKASASRTKTASKAKSPASTVKKPASRSKAPTTVPKPAAEPHVMPDMPGMPAHNDTSHSSPARPMEPMAGMSDSTAHNMPGMRDSTASMKEMVMPGKAPAAKPVVDTKAGDMGGMTMMTPDPLGVSMDRMGSGTTWVPDAAPIPSLYFAAPGRWDVTGHGFAFLQYDRQDGPRGGRQVGSLNWMMLMASHALAGGRIQARTMLSLDALTVTPRGYPLLLQSGEAYDGEPLHDRQHPHDFFMELSALYERPVTSSVGITAYAAPSGEPALGPVAFMHRPSAMDNPTAPISHHWQDATHVAFGVLSVGIFTHTLKVEGSVFNGREPNQHRFDFDPIRFDSYSGRITYNPTSEWSVTGGYGYLKSPEALNPTESLHRITASLLYGSTLGTHGQWAASAIWGANTHSTQPGLSHSMLLEADAVLDERNTWFGRAEYVQKSAEDLALDTPQYGFAAGTDFNVGAVTAGYIRDFARFGKGTLGLGAMGTLNIVPSGLSTAYGSRTPLGAMVFLRLRPFRTGASMSGMGPMPGMTH